MDWLSLEMTKFKGVLFDLDGTLIDSEHYYFSNWQPILLDNFGIDISYEDWLSYFAGHTLQHNVSLLNEKWEVDTDDKFMWDQTRASYQQMDMSIIRLMPYAEELLAYLKEKELPIGLVTSSYESTVQKVLGQHQLLSYFDFFVTRDHVEKPKPDAEPYLKGINQLGLPNESILAIEDTITGATSAKSAGLYCVGVSAHHVERTRLKAKADILFTNLGEVLENRASNWF